MELAYRVMFEIMCLTGVLGNLHYATGSVKTFTQCERLYHYEQDCGSFAWERSAGRCQLFSDKKRRRQVSQGMCLQQRCGIHQVCVPVEGGTNYRCLRGLLNRTPNKLSSKNNIDSSVGQPTVTTSSTNIAVVVPMIETTVTGVADGTAQVAATTATYNFARIKHMALRTGGPFVGRVPNIGIPATRTTDATAATSFATVATPGIAITPTVFTTASVSTVTSPVTTTVTINSTSATNTTAPHLLGCYQDSASRSFAYTWSDPLMTVPLCEQHCREESFNYFGLEYGVECFCGSVIPSDQSKLQMSSCDFPCGGDSTSKCGGLWKMSLYRINGTR